MTQNSKLLMAKKKKFKLKKALLLVRLWFYRHLIIKGYFSNNVEYDGRNLLSVNNSYHINSNLCIALLNTCL